MGQQHASPSSYRKKEKKKPKKLELRPGNFFSELCANYQTSNTADKVIKTTGGENQTTAVLYFFRSYKPSLGINLQCHVFEQFF